MDLYFSPLACSLASRIVIYEAGAEANFHRVDTKAGRTAGGADYRRINPKGLVPALRTDEGEVLTENAAILTYLGDRLGLNPEGFERYRLASWLSFIGSELHKFVFTPLLSPKFDAAAKALALEAAAERFAYLDDELAGREHLLDRFTVADAYLAVVLNWAQAVKLDLARWPNVVAYRDRVRARPAVARALGEEFALYQAA
ncbi:glutathione binding-like protein [Phenylobacterium sp.]|jgi:glutathione S-transferase|uniref:glutathione binding-like protein n=1 Tax=Phenylobacterium sp. TaxID=1871053 RepID=UPI002F9595E2